MFVLIVGRFLTLVRFCLCKYEIQTRMKCTGCHDCYMTLSRKSKDCDYTHNNVITNIHLSREDCTLFIDLIPIYVVLMESS